jgi:hypothetical protein
MKIRHQNKIILVLYKFKATVEAGATWTTLITDSGDN